MVRNYKKTTSQHSWCLEAMKKAVYSVVSGEMGYKKAAKTHNVPQSTLERYVTKYRKNPEDFVFKKKLGHFTTVFSAEQEEVLVNYIRDMEARFHGLTSQEMRKLAFELAQKNNISNSFDTESGLAGQDWLKGFLKRHPEISYRKPEPTSAARAMGFNRVAVERFFELLDKVYDKHKISPQRIFNVDETGVSTVPKSHSKILAACGKRQVGTLTSAERGKLMTAILCFSAVGSYMPPMFIFPRKRMKPELLDGAPAGSWGECHESGWIQGHLFIIWLKRFIEWSHSSKDDPVLLLLDGHATHVKSIEVIELARENGVILLCFPPHCTHRLQPLDVGFMKPLSTYYGNEIKSWLRSHPGRVVTQFQTAALFGKAFIAAATMATATNAFRATGIWPMNVNIFTDADFAPAETTDSAQPVDRPIIDEDIVSDNQTTPRQVLQDEPADKNMPPPQENSVNYRSLVIDQTSSPLQERNQNIQSRQRSPEPSCSGMTPFQTTPEQIMPLPKEQRTTKRASKRRGKTAIITESPYKNELISLQKGKESKENLKKVKKAVSFDTNEKQKKRKPIKNKKEIPNNDDADVECIYCGYWWSQSTEGWITCKKCGGWAHCSCAGEDDEDVEATHLCVMCEE